MKNGEFPNKETQFTSENQPDPKAKSKGWERRREAQKIMDEIMKLADMPYSEIKELLNDIQKNPDKHTLREVKLANYLMEKKYTVDYLDRHISKAPTEVNLSADVNVKKESKSLKELFNFEQAKRGTNRQGKGSSK